MQDTIIDIAGRTEPGYGICIDSQESWIVAVNNAGPDSDPANATFFGAHPATDETFILVKGKGAIAVAPHETPEDFTVVGLEQGVCVNVKRNTWHVVLMAPEATVAICENRNPTSVRYTLSDDERRRLVAEAAPFLR